MSSLSLVGVVWAFLSFVASAAASVGLYLPFWLEGMTKGSVPVYFGLFRRCNYPSLSSSGSVIIVEECGRYTTFMDIPSLASQIATITIGTGCGVAVIVSLTALMALCVSDLISEKLAKIAGIVQFVAGMLIGGGVAIYPHGWDSVEIQQACGNTSYSYHLGMCTLSWAFYMTGGAAGVTLLCSLLSCHAAKNKSTAYHI
ncbi:LHFPL tetraspan subfamily member 6 protein isoform X1 [Argonauta hians]